MLPHQQSVGHQQVLPLLPPLRRGHRGVGDRPVEMRFTEIQRPGNLGRTAPQRDHLSRTQCNARSKRMMVWSEHTVHPMHRTRTY